MRRRAPRRGSEHGGAGSECCSPAARGGNRRGTGAWGRRIKRARTEREPRRESRRATRRRAGGAVLRLVLCVAGVGEGEVGLDGGAERVVGDDGEWAAEGLHCLRMEPAGSR